MDVSYVSYVSYLSYVSSVIDVSRTTAQLPPAATPRRRALRE
jgi:hypothetical protein